MAISHASDLAIGRAPVARRAILALALVISAAGADAPPAHAANGSSSEGEGPSGNPSPIRLDRLNAGLPRLADPLDLETPQSTLEGFIAACRSEDFARASHALNLNDVPPDRQPEAGRRLARQLITVMDEQVWFHWDEVPDRPDGMAEGPSPARVGARGPRACCSTRSTSANMITRSAWSACSRTESPRDGSSRGRPSPTSRRSSPAIAPAPWSGRSRES